MTQTMVETAADNADLAAAVNELMLEVKALRRDFAAYMDGAPTPEPATFPLEPEIVLEDWSDWDSPLTVPMTFDLERRVLEDAARSGESPSEWAARWLLAAAAANWDNGLPEVAIGQHSDRRRPCVVVSLSPADFRIVSEAAERRGLELSRWSSEVLQHAIHRVTAQNAGQ